MLEFTKEVRLKLWFRGVPFVS